MTKTTKTFLTSFVKGVRHGLVDPFLAFNPPRIRTKIDRRLLESSYRPISEDRSNIQRDFNKALTNARKEIFPSRN